jgi:hypothetical protein
MKSTERHCFQNTVRTYHYIIKHIFKKKKKSLQIKAYLKIDILNKIKQNMFDRYLKMKNYEVLKQKVSQLTKICMSCSACSLMETDL